MTETEFVDYVESKIAPHSLNVVQKANLSILFRKYYTFVLRECVDIGISNYFRYENGELTQASVETFLNKLGGIAYNITRDSVSQEVWHITQVCKKYFRFWNQSQGSGVLWAYVNAMRDQGWSEEDIEFELHDNVLDFSYSCPNWITWLRHLNNLIDDMRDY